MDKERSINRIVEQFSQYASAFAEIYNSANYLYPEGKRYPVTAEVFEKQLVQDMNYVYRLEGKMVAFFSYREHENYVELTSLYVDYAHQRKGLGEELLLFFERLLPSGTLLITKALKDSPWAVRFYKKHGFREASDNVFQRMQYQEKPWETVLYKVKK